MKPAAIARHGTLPDGRGRRVAVVCAEFYVQLAEWLEDGTRRALADCGYRILTRSAAAGVDMFARQDKSFHLFLQGHPEYEAKTLLREYRRDVGRYLRRERCLLYTSPSPRDRG